jgi:hypothetical protein
MEDLFKLSVKIHNGLAGQDSASVVDAAEGLLDKLRSIPKGDIWRLLQQSSVPSVAFVSSFDRLFVPWDRKSLFLEPVKLSTVPVADRPHAEWLISAISVANGFQRIWNTFLVVLMSVGGSITTCPILHGFKWYLQQFGSEPFLEKANGSVVLLGDDMSVVLRTRLTTNCLWWWGQENKVPLRPVIEELWRFMFMNPMKATDQLKKWKSVFIQTAFAKPSGGERFVWDKSLSSTKIERITPKSKHEEYLLLLRAAERDENEKAMRDAGLDLVADMLVGFGTARLNEDNMSAYSFAVFLEALSGYMRTDFGNQFRQEVDETNANPPAEDFVPPFSDDLIAVWDDFFTNHFRLPGKHELERWQMTELTNRSCGLPRDEIPNIATVVKLGTKALRLEWALNSKREYGLYKPQELYKEQILVDSLTHEHPGRVFIRCVPARRTRKVLGGTTHRHVVEVVIARQLQSYLGNHMTAGSPTTTLEIDSGRYFTDFAEYFYNCGTGDLLTLLIDFDTYDETEKFRNVRQWMLVSLKKAQHLFKSEAYAMFGRFDPLAALYYHWSTLYKAVYKLDGVSPNMKEEDKYLILDQLLSGEFNTLNVNNMTHIAYQRFYMRHIVSALPLRMHRTSLQGDDEITLFSPGDFFDQSSKVQAEMAGKLLEIVSKSASANLLAVADKKTWIRRFGFEFLKKMGMHGRVIPRMTQLQMNEKERVTRDDDPIGRMRSRVGELREWVLRGGCFRQALARLHIEWAIIRVVRGRKIGEVREEVILPYEIMWVPQGQGGVGALMHQLLDPNVDPIIALYHWDSRTERRIGAWIQAYKKNGVQLEKDVAIQVADLFTDGAMFVKSTDDPDRAEKSLEAAKWFVSQGHRYKPTTATYATRHQQMMIEMLEQSPRFAQFRVRGKIMRALASMKEYRELIKVDAEYSQWRNNFLIEGIQFRFTDVIKDEIGVHFVAGMDPFVQRWMNELGTNAETNAGVSGIIRALKDVVSDPNFPRDMRANQPDTLAETMLKNGLQTEEEIRALLVERGASISRAMTAASVMQRNIQQAMFVRDIASYSTAGDGLTDKTKPRIDTLVNIILPALQNDKNPIGQVLSSIGYLILRNEPLIESGMYRPRRKVEISITTEGLKRWAMMLNTNDASVSLEI